MMYEVVVYNWLEQQYMDLLEKGMLELKANWFNNPPKFLFKKDRKLYETLLGMLTECYWQVEPNDLVSTPFLNSTQRMFVNFATVVLDYANECGRLTAGLDPQKEEDNKKAGEIISNLRLSRAALKYKLTRGFSIKKRWKFLNHFGMFENNVTQVPNQEATK